MAASDLIHICIFYASSILQLLTFSRNLVTIRKSSRCIQKQNRQRGRVRLAPLGNCMGRSITCPS